MKRLLFLLLFAFLPVVAQGQDAIFKTGFEDGQVAVVSYTGPARDIITDQATLNPVYSIGFLNKTDQLIKITQFIVHIVKPSTTTPNPFINPVRVDLLDENGQVIGTQSEVSSSALNPPTDPRFIVALGFGVYLQPNGAARILLNVTAKTVAIPAGNPRAFWFRLQPNDVKGFYSDAQGSQVDPVELDGTPDIGWELDYPE